MKTKGIAKFEYVSDVQLAKDIAKELLNGNENVTNNDVRFYKEMRLPRRATKGSAGYDFFAPFTIILKPGETIKFPTGVRCRIDEGWMLTLVPRSGLGFKYRLQLDNTIGIIDSDYYNSSNEGHIFVKLTNDSREGKTVVIEQGTAYMQGIFIPFGTVEDDAAEGIRDGGFGSTTKNQIRK